MYKLLALDMDGTLLNRKKIIAQSVKVEIQNLLKRGIPVTLASGRFPASLFLHARHLGLRFPLIALNGAVIIEAETGKAIHQTPIDSKIVVQLAEFCINKKVYIHFYGHNVLWVQQLNEMNKKWPLSNVLIHAEKELTEDNYKDQLSHFKVQPVGMLNEYFSHNNQTVFKATIIDDNESLVHQLYEEIKTWPGLAVSRTGKRRFDINAVGVNKQRALSMVCKNNGIKREEVVAVGDFDNDIEMLEWAGLGIAMGNGSDTAKQAADVIECSNEEDGIAVIITKYFSGRFR